MKICFNLWWIASLEVNFENYRHTHASMENGRKNVNDDDDDDDDYDDSESTQDGLINHAKYVLE